MKKVTISRFFSSGKVASVSNLKTYEEFEGLWHAAQISGLKPYLIGSGHLNTKHPLRIFPTMFDASGSTKAVKLFVEIHNQKPC